MQPTEPPVNDTVEVALPLQSAQFEALVAACAALGNPLQQFLTEALQQAVQAQIMRHQQLLARLAAAEASAQQLGVRIVNPQTREVIDVQPRGNGQPRPVFVPPGR